jgi:hypothetical protein
VEGVSLTVFVENESAKGTFTGVLSSKVCSVSFPASTSAHSGIGMFDKVDGSRARPRLLV